MSYVIDFDTNANNVITSVRFYSDKGLSDLEFIDEVTASQIDMRNGSNRHTFRPADEQSAYSLWNILTEKWGTRSPIREAPLNEA